MDPTCAHFRRALAALCAGCVLHTFVGPRGASAAPPGEPTRAQESVDSKARLRELVRAGLLPEEGARGSISAERREAALREIAALSSGDALRAAIDVLEGEGTRPNLLATDPQVRRALFAAMAREAEFGQPRLVAIAVTADDPVGTRAADALPKRLSPAAMAELGRQLGSDRELHVNKAAALAAAHAAAELIPALVSAQYAPPRPKKQGDEAWIAIGKTVHYVQNVIPVVGGASTSFQPVIGTVYEGSLLRVMESHVEIFRTEVHESLAMVVEGATGQPAPPFGYDRERWMAWYQREFPQLAEARRVQLEEAAHAARTRTTPGAREE